LQTVSYPIVCAQQPGYPDVSRISCTSSSVRGNVDVFIVGKNFSNNATVYMKEYGADGKIVWSAPAAVDQQHVHTCHMICTVPPYRDLYANKCIEVMLTVECGKKISRPLSFKYLPDTPLTNTIQPQQQQVAFDPTYSLDGLGGANSTTGSAAGNDVQQNYWPQSDFTNSGMQPDQQQYQQQPLLSATAPAAVVVEQAPAANFADFMVDANTAPGTKLEPFPDDQNASLYYSSQFDKTPVAKRPRGEETFGSDPFAFTLDDLPQLLS